MKTEDCINAVFMAAGHSCFGRLSERYARQAGLTGTRTTAKDAFEAWLDWLKDQGGKPAQPLILGDDANGFHRTAALAIRAASYLGVS